MRIYTSAYIFNALSMYARRPLRKNVLATILSPWRRMACPDPYGQEHSRLGLPGFVRGFCHEDGRECEHIEYSTHLVITEKWDDLAQRISLDLEALPEILRRPDTAAGNLASHTVLL
jgi:hypothetical protein